jgi:4-aminobutyrate aminotransferase-like enzyme
MSTVTGPALLASMRAPGESPPFSIVGGRGATLRLSDGREVIDAGSISASILGHAHPDLVAAIRRAADEPYVSDGFGHPMRDRAATDLLSIAFADEDWVGAVRFTTSASESNDLALLLAQTITAREPLVSRHLAYHGAVGLAREASNHPLWNGGLAARTGGWEEPPAPRAQWRMLAEPSDDVCGPRPMGAPPDPTLAAAPALLEGAAALITDYGSNGVLFPSGAYQDALVGVAHNAGALWISDEAVTGLGRLGRSFAFQHGATRPDIVTLGKGLTGGAACGGAVVLSRALCERLGERRWMTYSTFRGHPTSVAAVSATVRVIQRDGLIARAREVGEPFGAALRQVASAHSCVRRVAGEGLLWAIELDGEARHASAVWHGDGDATPLAEVVTGHALERGALMSAYSGLVVWLVPPLVIEERQLEQVIDILDDALGVADRVADGRRA